MQIDEKLLQNLEKLSNLTIADDKRTSIENELSDILKFVDNLSELDTDNISETFSTIEVNTELREDTPIKNKTASQLILANAPKSNGEAFIVPRIVD